MTRLPLSFSAEVATARAHGTPVVALESTIITHGMPYPQNIETASRVEAAVRAAGAVPATIAVRAGRIHIGLSDAELDGLGQATGVMKLSRADLAACLAMGRTGATTVAATMICAHLAGIDVFATGGIGGVHRGAETSFDISADLHELAATPVTVIAAGAKAILDLPKTLEVLETLGVPVIAFGQDELPAFWSRTSGLRAPLRMDSAAEIAKFKTVLTPAFLRTANLPNGRSLYNVTCGTCHTLFGQGQQIGPDLTGSNRADLDYVLENIVNPNGLIGKDYELHLITLKDGRSVAGMVRQETESALTVQSLTGSDTVAKKDITKHETPGFSMMPPGQLTAFTPEQQRDLVAYLASPAQVPLPGEPGAEKFVVANRIPGALEGEGLLATSTGGGTATAQPMENFVRGNWNWSGGAQLWWTGGKPGDRLDLTLPVPAPGTYEVQIVLTKAPDYAMLKFLLDGKPLDPVFDGFSPPGAGVIHSPVLTVAKTDLPAGDHRLTLEITGANPEATKAYMAGIDYVYLKRVP